MKDILKAGLALLGAFLFYSFFSKVSLSLVLSLNLFSLVVIYFAMKKGEIFGSFLGALAGLILDSMSSGIFGISGIAKTITGFLAGYFSRKIHVFPVHRNFLFLLCLMSIELGIWFFLYAYILAEPVSAGMEVLFLQPLVSAGTGAVLFTLIPQITKRLGFSENK